MGKNMKKVLSYALGIVLAMGIGLSYAYAVGANDSNAFVTKTEWQAKVTQLEAALDNITKTVNDSNMDYMMNSARLQVSVFEGFENIGAVSSVNGLNSVIHYGTIGTYLNLYPSKNDVNLQDTFDGRQKIIQHYWPTSTESYNLYALQARMAFKTNVPDVYVVASVFFQNSVFFHYVYVGTYPIYASQSAVPAITLSFDLPRDKWFYIGNSTTTPTTISRRNSNVQYGYNTSWTRDHSSYTGGAADGFSNSGNAYFTKAVTADKVTYTLEFPAQYNSMRVCGLTNIWDCWPIDMAGRKFAIASDRLVGSLDAKWGASVAKVYSPQKGCICLKSFTNGEIPIMNE